MTKYIRLQKILPKAWVKVQFNKRLPPAPDSDNYYDLLINGDEEWVVDKPDGTRLIHFIPNVIDTRVCKKARSALRQASIKGDSNHRPYQSAIIGYYDKRAPPLPPCRTTAYTGRELEPWLTIQPFIRATDAVFQKYEPDRHQAQLAVARRTPSGLIIGNTAFSTVTVNLWDGNGEVVYHNGQTPVHTDTGDLPEGFGVLSAITAGDFQGGYLVFLRYRVAVSLRSGVVLLADMHEPHCNVPIIGRGKWERISNIMYYRTGMQRCTKNNTL